MTKTTISRYIYYSLGICLLLSPTLRFSWDIYQQTMMHLLILPIVMFTAVIYRLKLKRTYIANLLLLLILPILTIPLSYHLYLARNEYFILLTCVSAGFLFSYLEIESKLKLLWIPVIVALWYSFTTIIYSLFCSSLGIFPLEIIVNYSILSSFLVIVLPLSFLEQFKKQKGWILIPIIIFAGILLTKSRVSIILALAFFTILLRDKHLRYSSYFKYLYIPVLFFIIYITFQKGYIINERILWWKTALKIFLDNPFCGAGWGNYASVYPIYRTFTQNSTLYAHNIFFQLIADMGIIGIAFFVILLNSAYCSLSKGFDKKYIVIKISIIFFLLLNLFNYTFYILPNMLLFFILISFHFKTKIVANRPRIRSYVIWVILSLIVSYNVLMPSISTFYYQRGNSHLRNNNVTVSIENLSKALKCDKYNPYNYTKLAELYTYKYSVSKLDNDIQTAIEFQSSAIDISPKSAQFWADLSWLYLLSSDREKAVKSIKTALELDPSNKKYKEIVNLYSND